MPENLNCVICDSEMIHYKKENFYRCPVCHTEVWPDEERLKQIEREKKRIEKAEENRQRLLSMVGTNLSAEVLPIYPHPSGKGGGSKSGRKRKKPKKLRKDLWGI